ncbi:unnamed protein product, partial [Mesorhabditis belari]
MESIPLIPNCPPGLEYLTQIDQIIVEQKVSLLEAFTEWEVKNKYAIYNGAGQQAYFAFEESDGCERLCCGAARGYTLHIVDNFQKEVAKITRPFLCCGNLCCQNETTIEAPPGNVIGVVRQQFGCASHNFAIYTPDGEAQLEIHGPNECGFGFACNCCADKVFKVKTLEGDTIGDIRKKWTGMTREYFTDADTFTVKFPIDLNVNTKATLIAATFLIDFLCFEDNNASR